MPLSESKIKGIEDGIRSRLDSVNNFLQEVDDEAMSAAQAHGIYLIIQTWFNEHYGEAFHALVIEKYGTEAAASYIRSSRKG